MLSKSLYLATLFQIFVEIALSRTVSKINALLRFTQKFKMAAKNGGESDFYEKPPVYSALWVKNFIEIVLSRTVSEISIFNVLRRNSRWPPKVAGK